MEENKYVYKKPKEENYSFCNFQHNFIHSYIIDNTFAYLEGIG